MAETVAALRITDAPGEAFPAMLGERLNDYNDAVLGYGDRRTLAVEVTDPATGEVLGGLYGRTSIGLLFIELVWLPERLRGQYVGTRMLAMAEAEGRARGCVAGMLMTISFQAPGFYARQGWRAFGDIPCGPDGVSRVFMTKALV